MKLYTVIYIRIGFTNGNDDIKLLRHVPVKERIFLFIHQKKIFAVIRDDENVMGNTETTLRRYLFIRRISE